jgi:thiamine-phosphate pyrophosphorylase
VVQLREGSGSTAPNNRGEDLFVHGPAGLGVVIAATRLPVVGVGGIVAGNAAQLLRAGATGVAVVSAVSQTEEPAAAVRRLASIVRRWRTLRAADGG